MIKAKGREGNYDELFEHLINNEVKYATMQNDDDYMIICVGLRGAGKSTLMKHAYELYAKDKANNKYITHDPEQFTIGLDETARSEKPRFLSYDEANVSKRQSMSTWNNELISTYYAIRGLNIFHWWSNPSLEILDKKIVEDLLKGVVLIGKKTDKKKYPNLPRFYYYFTADSINKIMEKHGKLNLRLLYRVRKKYAYWMGWFRDYKGPLNIQYEINKQERMLNWTAKLRDKYSNEGKKELLKPAALCKILGIHRMTHYSYMDTLIKSNKLLKDEHFIENITGHRLFKPDAIPIFIEEINRRKVEGK